MTLPFGPRQLYRDPVSGQSLLCGDWSRKMKLLRRIVPSTLPWSRVQRGRGLVQIRSDVLVFHFHSDHSRGFPGFVANVFLEDAHRSPDACNDRKMRLFGEACYLFIDYPQVGCGTISLLAGTQNYQRPWHGR